MHILIITYSSKSFSCLVSCIMHNVARATHKKYTWVLLMDTG